MVGDVDHISMYLSDLYFLRLNVFSIFYSISQLGFNLFVSYCGVSGAFIFSVYKFFVRYVN